MGEEKKMNERDYIFYVACVSVIIALANLVGSFRLVKIGQVSFLPFLGVFANAFHLTSATMSIWISRLRRPEMTNEVWSDGFLAVSVTAIMSILIASVITLFAVNMTRTDKEQFSVGLTFGACIINEKTSRRNAGRRSL